jgi:hypothetical protein
MVVARGDLLAGVAVVAVVVRLLMRGYLIRATRATAV